MFAQRSILRFITLLSIAIFSLFFTGCYGGSEHVDLKSILINPTESEIAKGTSVQFTAIGIFSDNSTTQDITKQVTWSSSASSTVVIDATGLATAIASGTTTISAALSGITASTPLTVDTSTLIRIEVIPANKSIALNTKQQFTAVGHFSDGDMQDLTNQVDWSSASSTVAIDATGLATAIASGATTISATHTDFGISSNATAFADNWGDWHSHEYNGYIKIQWRDNGKYSYEIILLKNRRWGNLARSPQSKDWDPFDSFEISRDSPKHSGEVNDLYWLVNLDYSVEADYKNGIVKSKGSVKIGTSSLSVDAFDWDGKFTDFTTDPIIMTTEGGFKFDTVSEFWRIMCSHLPCGPWVTFPGYGTAYGVIPGMMVNGKKQDVLVQLWKGYCPRFNDVMHAANMDMKDFGVGFPGGIGAEVGLYTTSDSSQLSWYPLVTGDVKIAFQLVNPNTGDIVVDAKEEATWWKTKWMLKDSYDTYTNIHGAPASPTDYRLRVWLNGEEVTGAISTWHWYE